MSKILSKIKHRIKKIIIHGNKSQLLKSTIEFIKNILGHNIEKIVKIHK